MADTDKTEYSAPEQTNEVAQTLLSAIGSNGEKTTGLSPLQLQQEYFENLPDYDWVKYELRDRKYLLQNVAFALFGIPEIEGGWTPGDSDNVQLEGYESRQKEQAMKVYSQLCEQSKFSKNDEDIYMSVLLIVCAKPKPLNFFEFEPSDYWVDLHQKNDADIDISYTAVFRVRRCIPTIVGAKSCKVYIDENARVYHSWESYLTNNTLPKCVIIAPEEGEYQGILVENEKTFCVKLTVTPSPSLGLKARVLSSADAASMFVTIGSLGVIGVAALTPVAPVALAGASVATVATGIYGIVRSSLHLHDRNVYEQSVSPLDEEARNSWINIAASSFALAGAGAGVLLERSAAAGANLTKTGRALVVSVEILRHANLITGGMGVLNSLAHIIIKPKGIECTEGAEKGYSNIWFSVAKAATKSAVRWRGTLSMKYNKHEEKPTALELFQFSAATLFFFGAVVSNRTAQNIVEDAQANIINDYRHTLRSNRHRKIFDKISSETRRTSGSVEGNVEVIQGIKNIVNKDQYYADVLKINKDINQHKLRISMTSDGQVKLNAAHTFNPTDLYNMGTEGRSQLFSSIGPATVTSSNVPTGAIPTTTSVPGYVDNDEGYFRGVIHPGEIIKIGSILLQASESGAEDIAQLLENLSQDAHTKLMTVVINLISNLLPEEISKLRLLGPDEDLISQVAKIVFDYLRQQCLLREASDDDNGIVIVLKQFFQNGVVSQDTIHKLKDWLLKWINNENYKRRLMYPNKITTRCPTCEGVRYA